MTLPLFFPPVKYVKFIERDKAIALDELCAQAGEVCQAFGPWTKRPIVLRPAAPKQQPWILAEPGDWGAVEIGVPHGSDVQCARWALGALAFVLFDGVARATVQGKNWAQIERPRGRDREPRRAMTNAERQRRFRARAKEHTAAPSANFRGAPA